MEKPRGWIPSLRRVSLIEFSFIFSISDAFDILPQEASRALNILSIVFSSDGPEGGEYLTATAVLPSGRLRYPLKPNVMPARAPIRMRIMLRWVMYTPS